MQLAGIGELALVSGREHQTLLRVGDRHQQRATDPRLDILLREPIVVLGAKEIAEEIAVALVNGIDVDEPRLDAEVARKRLGVRNAVVRRKGPGHQHTEHVLCAQGLNRQIRRDRRVDATREPDHGAGRKRLLVKVVADSQRQPGG